MRKYARIPVSFETMMKKDELLEKISEEQKRLTKRKLSKRHGEMLFLWEKKSEEVRLTLYHAVKKDMPDTKFSGTIRDGLDGCQLDGYIKKPLGVWVIFWAIAIVSLLIAIGFPFLLMQNPDIPIINAWPFLTLLVIPAFILMNLLAFEKKRLKIINDYLREFTQAHNTDVLDDWLEQEEARERL